jgi:HD-GYP domain-containing protein (c-di-GMP phosphodiesterase class II)
MTDSNDPLENLPLYQAAQQEVGRILEATSRGSSFSVDRLQQFVTEIARALVNGDELLTRALEPANTHLDLPRHMVNTAIFAMRIGQGAGCSAEEIPWLGLAASLHDVGMVIVPRELLELLEKPAALTEEEMVLVRRHPEKGFRILQGLGAEFDRLARAALQEHEREDGSGYPRGLKAGEISGFAQVIGLADMYEAFTHVRPHRNALGPLDAMRELIKVERGRFPGSLFKGLISGLPVFPVGSHVRLNSMETARIVATNPSFPLRPLVEVITGSNGKPLVQPRRVDLSTNTLLHVIEANSPAGAS